MGLIKDRFLGGAEREAGRIQARAAREAQFQNLIATREAVEALRQQFPGAESAINEAFAQQLGFLGAGQEQALGNILGFGQEAGRAIGRGGAQAREDIAGGFES